MADELRDLGIALQLSSQAGDVDVRGPGEESGSVTPNFLKELVARKCCSSMFN